MIGRVRHLGDDRLFDCYVADRTGESPDPRSAEHLGDCDTCSSRYGELVAFMNGLRADADAETDEVFSAARLKHQHDQILRRIEQHHSARVISFPGRASRPASAATTRVAPRWLAAAAAAGLFVGAAVGSTVLQPGVRRTLSSMRVGQGQPAAVRVAPAPPVRVSNPSPVIADTVDDDAFLLELELALERPHNRELQAFDALTPHVQEVDVR